MNLTVEQRESLSRGNAVAVEADGLQCVIVRADVFERIANYCDGDWTDDEMRLLATRTFEDADSAGPIS